MADDRHQQGRPVHAASRVLGRLTVGVVKEREAHIARTAGSKLREELFEFQVALAGTANEAVAWQPANCVFPAPMVPAPLQRDSDLTVPQFWFGYQLYQSSAPVVIVGYVSEWTLDDADYTVAAQCQLGAYTPGQSLDADFAGYAHLTFQGYSGPALEEDDQGV